MSLCVLLVGQTFAQENELKEYDLKVVYLYNFTKFVRWPNSRFATPESSFNICIKGKLPADAAVKHLQHKSTRGHPLRVIQINKTTKINDCHIVYFRNNDPNEIQKITRKLTNKPILTVGDYNGFALNDGVVEFTIDNDKRIKLRINHKRAKQCGISISAQLLEIASVVHTVEQI